MRATIQWIVGVLIGATIVVWVVTDEARYQWSRRPWRTR